MPRPHEIRTKPYKVISREVPPLRRKTGVIPALPPRMWRIPNIYPATYLFVDSPYTIHKQITLPHTAPSFPYFRNTFPSMPDYALPSCNRKVSALPLHRGRINEHVFANMRSVQGAQRTVCKFVQIAYRQGR